MLLTELFVFIRSLPQFSMNIYEELERIYPYVEVLEIPENSSITGREGWSLIVKGNFETPEHGTLKSKDMFYHSSKTQLNAEEPSLLICFSRESMDKFLRSEPELAIPLAEYMEALQERIEKS